MKTLAILSRKGGTGKTTLATHLSVAAERAGHTTALIDLDPQSSAAKWRDNRDGDTPAVISDTLGTLITDPEARREKTGRRSRFWIPPRIPRPRLSMPHAPQIWR